MNASKHTMDGAVAAKIRREIQRQTNKAKKKKHPKHRKKQQLAATRAKEKKQCKECNNISKQAHTMTVACATVHLSLVFSWIPDASWCPKFRRCGEAVAVFCSNTLRFHIYPVSIRMRLGNAYTAEFHTAWAAFSARVPSTCPTFTFPSRRVHSGSRGAEGAGRLITWRPATCC